jgi:hypothetical protein
MLKYILVAIRNKSLYHEIFKLKPKYNLYISGKILIYHTNY